MNSKLNNDKHTYNISNYTNRNRIPNSSSNRITKVIVLVTVAAVLLILETVTILME